MKKKRSASTSYKELKMRREKMRLLRQNPEFREKEKEKAKLRREEFKQKKLAPEEESFSRSWTIPEEKWDDYSISQETLSTVIEIREELMKEVLNRVQSIYLRNESVEFVVSCAAEAWRKIISLNFLNHEKDDDFTKPNWGEDSLPEPCKPDSYSVNNVIFQTEEPKIDELSLNLEDSAPETEIRLPVFSESKLTQTTDKTGKRSVKKIEDWESQDSKEADMSIISTELKHPSPEPQVSNLDLRFLESSSKITNKTIGTPDFSGASACSIITTEGSFFFNLKTRKSILPELRKFKKPRKSATKSIAGGLDSSASIKMMAQGRVKIHATHSQKASCMLPPISSAGHVVDHPTVKSALRIMINDQRKESRKFTKVSFRNLEDISKNAIFLTNNK